MGKGRKKYTNCLFPSCSKDAKLSDVNNIKKVRNNNLKVLKVDNGEGFANETWHESDYKHESKEDISFGCGWSHVEK